MFLLLSYRMNLDNLQWTIATSGNIASKRVDKKLVRSKFSLSVDMYTYLLLLSKLAVLSSTDRLPDHGDGELPCILLSTRASTLQLKTTRRYFPVENSKLLAALAHTWWNGTSQVCSIQLHMFSIRPQGTRVFRSNSHHPARPSCHSGGRGTRLTRGVIWPLHQHENDADKQTNRVFLLTYVSTYPSSRSSFLNP